ncbi:zinc finger and SCAN domain-containing protein 21-like [Sphaeramia orbicularis]|uniref:zinc finger and SCAN domain-containing protein 21-like n=1 Tax=Sphaeramia orbicularis TaxID=375764 RepID=UPI00117F010A|nr:zinc finger and SCAN domain-containing protein 21-like [Sphaeramia orbicularis]
MNTTMFQLRSFIHQRLYAAAEDILGEVEKTITLAVYDAKVGRPESENESLRHHLHKETGLSKDSNSEDQCGTSPLQEEPGSSMREDSVPSPTAEVPGPSHSGANLDNIDWSSCLAVPAIKEEQEDFEDDREKLEDIFTSLVVVKSEQEEPEIQVPYEGQPVSSHCSAGQSENSDAEENWVNSSETMQSQNVSVNTKDQGELCENSPGKSQKDRSFCYLCGKGFQYIGALMKHIKTHDTKTECTICRKTYRYTKQLIKHLRVTITRQTFVRSASRLLPIIDYCSCMKKHTQAKMSLCVKNAAKYFTGKSILLCT